MLKTPLIVDIETDGRAPQEGKLLCIGYQFAKGESARVWTPGWDAEEATLRAALADPETPIVTMTKYDARYLQLQGWDVTGPYYDLQVMAWCLNENQMLSLDALAKRYAGVTMDKRIKRRDAKPWFLCDSGELVPLEVAPSDQLAAYCARDVEAETELFNVLSTMLHETAWWDYFIDELVPLTEVLLSMEVAGLPVNLDESESLRARLEVEAESLRAHLLSSASLPPGFNVNSRQHLEGYLYGKTFELGDRIAHEPGLYNGLTAEGKLVEAQRLAPEGFLVQKAGRVYDQGVWCLKGRGIAPTARTDSDDAWSTSSPVLKSNFAAMQDEWVVELLHYRKVQKVLTTYLRRFPELAQDGRLYGRFNQTGTKTGRLSSSEPNLQNIPAHGELGEAVRGLFQGDLVVGDYSQLEPRLMAHFSGDPVLTDVYTTGKDVYAVTGQGIFGGEVAKDSAERGIAKTLVLAMGYGAGPDKVAQILTVNGFPTDADTARGYLKELRSLYSTFFNWREAVIDGVKQRGHVSTLSGRHRRLRAAFEDRRNWKNIGYGERQAVNAVVQGSAGDIVSRVMVAAHREWGEPLRLLAQVHDELVWELQPGFIVDLDRLAKMAQEAHGFNLRVPLVFEPHRGTSWFAAKEGIELPDDMLDATEGEEG